MVGGSAGVIVHGHGVGCIGHRANGLSYPITLIVPGPVGWVKGAVSWDRKSCLDRSVSRPTESPQPANLFGGTRVIVGLVLAGIGLIWVLAPNLPRLGRLPGDIVIERENSRFYFPIVTCIVISAVLSLIMWLIREENKDVQEEAKADLGLGSKENSVSPSAGRIEGRTHDKGE